ncbi:hypothetical protein I7I53_03869 [Histoplasma capsulatum var. duboisii H88]|uniref:Uncharacterized protein n=1 Tax=Ajellomyces capsulatus (strain H88) TaxID=544711 RepID=A0A8A1LQ02_AJEC8|nr:hypothetical protein I7I53_03869 [Histoplasma capsulatum var. duboisii H88]
MSVPRPPALHRRRESVHLLISHGRSVGTYMATMYSTYSTYIPGERKGWRIVTYLHTSSFIHSFIQTDYTFCSPLS